MAPKPTAIEKPTALIPRPSPASAGKQLELVQTLGRDVNTGAPVFTFQAVDGAREAGRISFYGHPLICRSEDGLRHNAVERTGIFAEAPINPSELTEVCASMPPDEMTLRFQAMDRSVARGMLLGSTRVLESALQQQGVSAKVSSYASTVVYYVAYWLMSFAQHYQTYSAWAENAALDSTAVILKAAMSACFDILYLFMTTAICAGLSQGARHAAPKVYQAGWTRTAQGLHVVDKHAHKLVYAKGTWQDGILNTGLNFVCGAAAQHGVENAGKQLLTLMNRPS